MEEYKSSPLTLADILAYVTDAPGIDPKDVYLEGRYDRAAKDFEIVDADCSDASKKLLLTW